MRTSIVSNTLFTSVADLWQTHREGGKQWSAKITALTKISSNPIWGEEPPTWDKWPYKWRMKSKVQLVLMHTAFTTALSLEQWRVNSSRCHFELMILKCRCMSRPGLLLLLLLLLSSTGVYSTESQLYRHSDSNLTQRTAPVNFDCLSKMISLLSRRPDISTIIYAF